MKRDSVRPNTLRVIWLRLSSKFYSLSLWLISPFLRACRKKYPFLFNKRRTVQSVTWRIPVRSIRRRKENEPSCSLNSSMVLRINASCSGVSFFFLPLKCLLLSCTSLYFEFVTPWTLAVETWKRSAISFNVRFEVIFRTLIEAFVSSDILFLEGMLSEDFPVLFGKLCKHLRISFTLCYQNIALVTPKHRCRLQAVTRVTASDTDDIVR